MRAGHMKKKVVKKILGFLQVLCFHSKYKQASYKPGVGKFYSRRASQKPFRGRTQPAVPMLPTPDINHAIIVIKL